MVYGSIALIVAMTISVTCATIFVVRKKEEETQGLADDLVVDESIKKGFLCYRHPLIL
jgi:hypothetical protein